MKGIRCIVFGFAVVFLIFSLVGCVPLNQKEQTRQAKKEEQQKETKKNENKVTERKTSSEDQNESGIEQQQKARSISQEDNAELLKLLPHREGYRWVYSGFADYSHSMTLVLIDRGRDSIVYYAKGEVEGVSDGESKKDPGIMIKYEVRDGRLIQTRFGRMMMDSIFQQIDLIRFPLKKGNTWEQQVTDEQGSVHTVRAEITQIREEKGLRVFEVVYRDAGGEYYERREIKEGVGVVSFSRLEKIEDESFEVGYRVFYPATGYVNKKMLEQFLPPLDKILYFFGLAEYGHEGKLKKISSNTDSAVYVFEGVYRDGMGTPDKFTVEYTFDFVKGTVTERVLENERTGKKELNSKLYDAVILKLPLETGNTWYDEVKIDGKKYIMKAQIISIYFAGNTPYSPGVTEYDRHNPIVKVRYTVEGIPGYFKDTYIEEREFQAGKGMISFANLMPGDIGLEGKEPDTPYAVEEAFINHMFGYSLAE